MVMNITNKTILITGANRGIGKALVEEALRRGAKKVYAGMRSLVQHPDKRVTPLILDVTSASQIQQAVKEVDMLDVLINNAGIAIYDDLGNLEVLEQTFAVNILRSAQSDQRVLAASETFQIARRDVVRASRRMRNGLHQRCLRGDRVRCGSRSTGTATNISVDPTSIPAALGSIM
jgi:NAD(P)-dependent dehydrogenase (short-subunit alcohol dehydrogenase family)